MSNISFLFSRNSYVITEMVGLLVMQVEGDRCSKKTMSADTVIERG